MGSKKKIGVLYDCCPECSSSLYFYQGIQCCSVCNWVSTKLEGGVDGGKKEKEEEEEVISIMPYYSIFFIF